MKKNRRIYAYHIGNRTVQFFDSLTDACHELGVGVSKASAVCHHRGRNCCGGYIFGKEEGFDKAKLDKMLDKAQIKNRGRAVIHILKDGTVEKYDCEAEAHRLTGIPQISINQWLNGKRAPRDGSVWKYDTDELFVPMCIIVKDCEGALRRWIWKSKSSSTSTRTTMSTRPT